MLGMQLWCFVYKKKTYKRARRLREPRSNELALIVAVPNDYMKIEWMNFGWPGLHSNADTRFVCVPQSPGPR